MELRRCTTRKGISVQQTGAGICNLGNCFKIDILIVCKYSGMYIAEKVVAGSLSFFKNKLEEDDFNNTVCEKLKI